MPKQHIKLSPLTNRPMPNLSPIISSNKRNSIKDGRPVKLSPLKLKSIKSPKINNKMVGTLTIDQLKEMRDQIPRNMYGGSNISKKNKKSKKHSKRQSKKQSKRQSKKQRK
jgi:hypothetical protein